MKRRTPLIPGLVLAAAAAVGLAACEAGPGGDADLDTRPVEQPTMTPSPQEGTGMTQPQELYEARLEARGESGVTGIATLTVQGDELQVTVAATGLDPDAPVNQHIHLNASCDDAGGILLNLDGDLSVANEGPPRGDAYPSADADGRLEYEASRSLEEVRTAIREQGGAAAADSLDLGNRVVNLHNAEMQPVACGAIDPIDGANVPQTQRP